MDHSSPETSRTLLLDKELRRRYPFTSGTGPCGATKFWCIYFLLWHKLVKLSPTPSQCPHHFFSNFQLLTKSFGFLTIESIPSIATLNTELPQFLACLPCRPKVE